MTFASLPAGTSIFVDANPFIYAFAPDPVFGPPSEELLERIENQELQGYTSSHILAEVAHRLMTLEACAAYGWPHSGIAQRLRRHPSELQSLTRYCQALDEIVATGIQVISLTGVMACAAATTSQKFGLLTNDALIVVAMNDHGLTNVASSDSDLDRVPGLIRYSPL